MEERVGGEEFCRKHSIGGAVASAWARWRIAVRSPNFIWRMDVTPGEKYDAVAKPCGYELSNMQRTTRTMICVQL